MKVVSGHVFQASDLNAAGRPPGLSAFMRIRNGADFVEATIRSHVGFFDEIVAVYNQCTDATPALLGRLEQAIGPKLRVFHYTDRVFPPGSSGHAATPATSPASMVNYSNFALAMTSRRTVAKLDDDHIAIPGAVAPIISRLRESGGANGKMLCFSGINLFRAPGGGLGILARDPIAGSGDHGFFDVSESTFFTHDPRFERAPRFGSKRMFCGFLYWHVKYMKVGLGFANYELESNPRSRYAKRRAWFDGRPEVIELGELKRRVIPSHLARAAALVSAKERISVDRAMMLSISFPENSVAAAVRRTVAPEFLEFIGLSADDAMAGRCALEGIWRVS
jgi:hypothetical protein